MPVKTGFMPFFSFFPSLNSCSWAYMNILVGEGRNNFILEHNEERLTLNA